MNDVHINKFREFIKNEYLEFRKDIHYQGLSSNLSKAMINLLLKCPNEKSSKLSFSFEELGLFEKSDFINRIDRVHGLLKIPISNYIWKDLVLQDEWFERFIVSIEKSKSFVYMYKSGKHLETLFIKLRNAIAHGQYYIKGNRIILWNSSTKDNITALFHMRINQFVTIVKILEDAYENKNTSKDN